MGLKLCEWTPDEECVTREISVREREVNRLKGRIQVTDRGVNRYQSCELGRKWFGEYSRDHPDRGMGGTLDAEEEENEYAGGPLGGAP